VRGLIHVFCLFNAHVLLTIIDSYTYSAVIKLSIFCKSLKPIGGNIFGTLSSMMGRNEKCLKYINAIKTAMMLTLSQYIVNHMIWHIYLVFICEFIEAKAKSKYTSIPSHNLY
jgi:hypothetical protein